MSRRRRTSPPPDSMAGPLLMSLGLVGILVGVSLVGLLSLDLGLGLGGLGVGDRLVLCLDLLNRLVNLNRSRLGRRRLLRRTCLTRTIGLRRHRLLPHQLDDGHRGVVAL